MIAYCLCIVMALFKYCALFLLILLYCDAYKILIVSPMPGRSHGLLGYGLVKHLLNAGHEVTLVTSMPNNVRVKNFTEINVGDNHNEALDDLTNLKKIMDKEFDVTDFALVMSTMRYISTSTLQHERMRKLISDPRQQFDVIIAEWMFNELYAALPAFFNCPFIWFSTSEPSWIVLKIIDDLPSPAYTQDGRLSTAPPFTFIQRVQGLLYQISGLAFQHFSSYPTELKDYEEIIAPVLRKLGKPVPPFEVLKRNVSLMLGNSHESLGQTMRLPLNYKAIAGYHIDTNVKPLPQSLQIIMDNAKNGVIYFSMGSNLKSKELPNEVKTNILKMFGDLKQTVIWKFEDDLPNRPNNVHIVQWAPQHSILNHPNCILFITHGGYLSLTETIHFGVPVIGIPVFGDQFSNVVMAVNKGYAKKVDLSYSMVNDLKLAIHDILGDSKYSKRAKELSLVYHDRPVSPGDEMVHWVEHVIRTGGALHLRSPALDVAWYSKMYLDLVVVIFITLIIIKYLIKYLLKLYTSSTVSKEKKTM